MVYTEADVKKLGSILGIWAHPDDESWCSAGLMKMAMSNGQKVGIITATKGSAGQTADTKIWPKKELSGIRVKELEDCLCNIGDIQQFWLEYTDGNLISVDITGVIVNITRIINVFKPDTIITFEPNGITGHDDHKTVSFWASEVVRKIDSEILILQAIESKEKYEKAGRELDEKFNIFFNIKEPNLIAEKDADVCIKLSDDLLECKLCCLKAHASQTAKMFASKEGRESVKKLISTECFMRSNEVSV